MASTAIQWRVQWKKKREHKWRNGGLYETRANARYRTSVLRERDCLLTRIVRYERRGK